jgi:hypothetical protein
MNRSVLRHGAICNKMPQLQSLQFTVGKAIQVKREIRGNGESGKYSHSILFLSQILFYKLPMRTVDLTTYGQIQKIKQALGRHWKGIWAERSPSFPELKRVAEWHPYNKAFAKLHY